MKENDNNHHNVYVIELDPTVLNSKKFREENPNYNPSLACLYVGMTGKSPDERFAEHKNGYKSCRYVRNFGLYLRRRMFEKYNPMTYAEAKNKEVELAVMLRKKGHTVWQR